MSTTNDVVEDLKRDPEINGLIEEEKALIASSNADDNTLESAHLETVKHIEDALNKDKKGSIQKVKGLVENKLKEYGGYDKTVEMLNNADVSKIPRFIQKILRTSLPMIINYLRDKRVNPEWIAAIEGLLARISKNLIDTKKPGFFSNLFGKKTDVPGVQKGGDGEEFLFMIGWIAFLIGCCATGIGCFVCGPLLVLTFCGMLGQNGIQLCASLAQPRPTDPKSGPKPNETDNQKGGRSQRHRRSQRQRRNQKHRKSQKQRRSHRRS